MALKKFPPTGAIEEIKRKMKMDSLCNQIARFFAPLKMALKFIFKLAKKIDSIIAAASKMYGELIDSLLFKIDIPEFPTPANTALMSSALADCALIPEVGDVLNDAAGYIPDLVSGLNENITNANNLWNGAMENARKDAMDNNPFGQVKNLEGQLKKLCNKKIYGINKSVFETIAYIDALVACCDASVLIVKNAGDQVKIFKQYFKPDGTFIRSTTRHGERFVDGMENNSDNLDTLLKKTGF